MQFRNAALWVAAIGASVGISSVVLMINKYMLPLSASEALNGTPRGAHELGFWFLVLISSPFWLIALWLSTLATVNNMRGQRLGRCTIWAVAVLLSALAMAAITNILGFGDLFSPL